MTPTDRFQIMPAPKGKYQVVEVEVVQANGYTYQRLLRTIGPPLVGLVAEHVAQDLNRPLPPPPPR